MLKEGPCRPIHAWHISAVTCASCVKVRQPTKARTECSKSAWQLLNRSIGPGAAQARCCGAPCTRLSLLEAMLVGLEPEPRPRGQSCPLLHPQGGGSWPPLATGCWWLAGPPHCLSTCIGQMGSQGRRSGLHGSRLNSPEPHPLLTFLAAAAIVLGSASAQPGLDWRPQGVTHHFQRAHNPLSATRRPASNKLRVGGRGQPRRAWSPFLQHGAAPAPLTGVSRVFGA